VTTTAATCSPDHDSTMSGMIAPRTVRYARRHPRKRAHRSNGES
jgi:hypothetical protein